MSRPVLLVFGAGANVGLNALQKFKSAGYATAAVVRTIRDENKDSADVVLQTANFGDVDAIQQAYSEVEKKLGTPNVVVYNAYGGEMDRSPLQPFGVSPATFAANMAVNANGLYAAAHAAAAGFERIAEAAGPRLFLFTGNGLPSLIMPELPGLGAGKSAAAFLIEAASHSLGAGKVTGTPSKARSHWYFVDERLKNGTPVGNTINGPAHAEEFWALANRKEQGPWNYTFVKGQGYEKFPDVVNHKHATWEELAEDVKNYS